MGLDCSTSCTGYGIFDDTDLIAYGAIKPRGKLQWQDRIREEWGELCRIVEKYKPEKVYVENIPLKDGKLTIQKLGAVQGMVLSLCAQYDMEVCFLLPSEWRGKLNLFDGTREGLQREILKQKAIEMVNKEFGLNLTWVAPKSKLNEDDTAEGILVAWSQIKPRAFGKRIKK